MNPIITAAILSAIPSAFWFFFWWRRDFYQKEPKMVLLQAYLAGILVALALYQLRGKLHYNWIILVVITAILEELLKSIGEVLVVEKNKRYFDQVVDGVEYAMSVAIGFAFIENIVYLKESLNNTGFSVFFWFIYTTRGIMTTLSHTIFTGIFGFAYANAYLLPEHIIPKKHRKKPFRRQKKTPLRYLPEMVWHILTLHIILSHILKNRPSRIGHTPNQVIFEGIMSAIYLHFIYNFLAMVQVGGRNLSFLLPGLVLITGWGLARQFLLNKYHEIIHRKR